MTARHQRLWAKIALSACVLAAACGGDDADSGTGSGSQTDKQTDSAATDQTDTTSDAAATGPGDLPDLELVDVSSGGTVNLQSVANGQTPLLLWFWAPH